MALRSSGQTHREGHRRSLFSQYNFLGLIRSSQELEKYTGQHVRLSGFLMESFPRSRKPRRTT